MMAVLDKDFEIQANHNASLVKGYVRLSALFLNYINMLCLYQPGDRRDRLRYLLSKIQGHDVESEEESGSEVEEEVISTTSFNKRVPINEIEIG